VAYFDYNLNRWIRLNPRTASSSRRTPWKHWYQMVDLEAGLLQHNSQDQVHPADAARGSIGGGFAAEAVGPVGSNAYLFCLYAGDRHRG
jgi:hypothetical protein